MRRFYLIYDASCSACSKLANIIKMVSNNNLEIIDINEEFAISLLNKTFPNGWKFLPYFLQVDQDGIRAWTRFNGLLYLVRYLGIYKSWIVLNSASEANLNTLPFNAGIPKENSFLKRITIQRIKGLIRKMN